MKKETVILSVVIAFIVGFIAGGALGVLYMVKKGESPERVAKVQRPQMSPQAAPSPAPQGISPQELTAKIQALKEIVKKDPKNLAAWMELGNLYFDSNQPKEAIEAYNQYVAVKPDNPDVRTDLGIMYKKIGDLDRAIEEFRRAAKIDPKHANSRYNIGIVLLHDKQDIKGAIAAFEDYLKADPKSERAERLRAQIEKMKTMVK